MNAHLFWKEKVQLRLSETAVLRAALGHTDDDSREGVFAACECAPDWMEYERGETPTQVELCLQFACMTGGGTLVAAGMVGGLSLGLFASPLFGYAGFAAAALGAALCAFGFVIGRQGSRTSYAGQ